MARVARAALLLGLLLPGTASALTLGPPVSIAPGHRLSGVACPSATFCLAVGSGGTAVSTTHPSGGWTVRRIGGGQALSAVACASAHFCAVLGTRGRVLTGAGAAWRTAHLALPKHASLTAVACPSAHLCVVTDSRGGVYTSAARWRRRAVTNQALNGVSCPSDTLCVATTNARRVLVSTRPTGSWRSLQVLPAGGYGSNAFDAISCPAMNLCFGAASDGFGASIVATHAPTSGQRWTTQSSYSSTEPRTNLVAANVACGSAHLCATYTVDQFGASVLYGYETSSGGASASATTVVRTLTGIACAKALCVAVDRRGGALVGR